MSNFDELLSVQIGNEFAASQQYLAIAVWYDNRDLPQLAKHFYRQSLEERNHAMMLVQYRLDRDLGIVIPGVGEVINEFKDDAAPIALALEQEKRVTSQIEALFAAARSESDALGEQFMLWFLKEQVEEVASMTTLLTVINRANNNLFDVENYLARESASNAGLDPDAPAAAGGAL
ncbi:MAG: ferritin [Microbacteriaceae bacterium]|nr:ferritin [Cryobacterium sp.]MCC6376475.1 ferritin [Microbacteriaceae bacterium]